MLRAAATLGKGLAGTSAVIVGALYIDFLRTYERPHPWSSATPDITPPRPPPTLPPLTPDELKAFHRDGYLVVRGVLPPDYLRALRDVALDYATRYEGAQKPFDKYSGRNAVHLPSAHARWAWDFVSAVGGLGIGLASAQLLAIADAGTEGAGDAPPAPVHCIFDSLDLILPGQRSAHRAPFRKEAAGHRPSLRAWIPLEPVTEANGATVIVPGSHRWGQECFMGHGPCSMCFPGVLDTPRCPNFDEVAGDAAARERYAPVQLRADVGDVVYLDPKTLHGWGPNDAPGAQPRVAMRLHLKSEHGMRAFADGPTAAAARDPVGLFGLLLQGWTPLHPTDFSPVSSPLVFPPPPRLSDGALPPPPTGWPREEPTFAEFVAFAAGSAARYAAWRAFGNAEVLVPPAPDPLPPPPGPAAASGAPRRVA